MNESGINAVGEEPWSEKDVEESAMRNRASWRRDCEEICLSGGYSPEIRDLSARMIMLIDETECVYNGGQLKRDQLVQLLDALEELRSRIRSK